MYRKFRAISFFLSFKCEEDDLEFYTMKEIEWSLQGYRGQSKSFIILERWFLTMMQTQINADSV